jgi:hypothetical protein
MGARYNVNRTSTALSTTNDLVTIVAPSTRALKIWKIAIYGQGTASANNEIAVARSTGGSTPGGGITPQPLATLSAASATNAYTTWTTQPTLGTVIVDRFSVNANGGTDVHNYPFGQEIDVPPSGQLSIRSTSGTSNVTIDIVFEEVG